PATVRRLAHLRSPSSDRAHAPARVMPPGPPPRNPSPSGSPPIPSAGKRPAAVPQKGRVRRSGPASWCCTSYPPGDINLTSGSAGDTLTSRGDRNHPLPVLDQLFTYRSIGLAGQGVPVSSADRLLTYS